MVDVLTDKTNMEIVWVGRSRNDPYWEVCSEVLNVTDFDDIYQPVAELLAGKDSGMRAGAFVINVSPFGENARNIIETLIHKNVADKVFAYSPAGKWSSLSNDLYLRSPAALKDKLEESVSDKRKEDSPAVADKPPEAKKEQDPKLADEIEKFKTAKISKEELQALLGSDR